MEKKVLTKEELQELLGLQDSYEKIVKSLGEIEIQKFNLNELINSLGIEKEYLHNDLKKIKEKETELAKTLTEKYGQGVIDVNTGEITPN